jgi:Fe-S-cluster containining protein
MPSPCQRCCACCATYCVSFHRDEIDAGQIPAGLTEPLTVTTVCMRGTGAQPVRCIALRGEIGESVSCAIYEYRPGACSEFAPLAAIGRGDEACDDARRRHGLPPLGNSPA